MSGQQIPWQYSEQLGGHYIYVTSRDEIVLRDGRRFPRPARIPPSTLQAAACNDTIADSIFDGSGQSSYSHSSGPAPHQSSLSTPRYQALSTSPAASSSLTPNELALRMRNMAVSGSGQPSSANQQAGRGTNVGQEAAYYRDRGRLRANVQTTARKDPSGRYTLLTDSSVVGPDETTETLFPKYTQRSKKFWVVGRVFSMLWSEPAGQSNRTQATDIYEEGISITVGRFKEKVHSKIRRFVVIREGTNYCNALPIATYGWRGVGKPTVNKSEHAIIYTISRPAPMETERPQRGELPMRSTAIRVDPDNVEDRLDSRSRLNFGHPHTIQHNIKAKSCGKVAAADIPNMLRIFADVFGITASGGTTRAGAPDDDDDDDDGDGDDGEDDDEEEEDEEEDEEEEGDGEEGDGEEDNDEEDDDEEDARTTQLRKIMRAMLKNGANPQDVFRTTLQSLVNKGLGQEEATNLIRKAYNQGE